MHCTRCCLDCAEPPRAIFNLPHPKKVEKNVYIHMRLQFGYTTETMCSAYIQQNFMIGSDPSCWKYSEGMIWHHPLWMVYQYTLSYQLSCCKYGSWCTLTLVTGPRPFSCQVFNGIPLFVGGNHELYNWMSHRSYLCVGGSIMNGVTWQLLFDCFPGSKRAWVLPVGKTSHYFFTFILDCKSLLLIPYYWI